MKPSMHLHRFLNVQQHETKKNIEYLLQELT